jgi:hypothetical protein
LGGHNALNGLPNIPTKMLGGRPHCARRQM